MTDTREYIIDVAYKLFLTRSYEAVSISEISKAIGLTKGALYHHFLNKEELFKAVINKYLDVFVFSNITEDMTLMELIRDVRKNAKKTIENLIDPSVNYVPVNYLSLIIDSYRHYPDFMSEKQNLFLAQIDKFSHVLKNGMKKGEIRKDLDPNTMAQILFSITTGIAVNLLHTNSVVQVEKTFNKQLSEYYKMVKI